MKASTQDLKADLAAAIDFFKTDSVAKELPYFWGFPKNCCESASTILGMALADKYPNSVVVRARGRTRSDDQHLWVEVDHQVVDATANQFPGYRSPFVRPMPSPLEREFPDIDRMTAQDALVNLELSFLRIDADTRDALIHRLFSRLNGTS